MEITFVNLEKFYDFINRQKKKDYTFDFYLKDLCMRAYIGDRSYSLSGKKIYFEYTGYYDEEVDEDIITITF